jgi:hypothetical protein
VFYSSKLTRESLRDLLVNQKDLNNIEGVCVVIYLFFIHTTNAKPQTSSNFIVEKMKKRGWSKVSGEGNYKGCRGLYTKPFVGENEHNTLLLAKEDFEVTKALLISGIQKYKKDWKKETTVHAILGRAELYDDDFINIQKLM